ncbi:MAG: thiamine pyrophosphate-binding protein [Actinobacteria bacterium]|nr:thiamine pyrophosphate-binding protein [Actinomycetota bacterium]
MPDAVIGVLAEAGVDAVFGMPGGYTLKLFDALIDHPEVRTVLTRDETLAGVMAEVYGRLTGKPGVVIGQGAFLVANALLGALEAHLGSAPMLLLGDATDFAPFTHHAPYQAGMALPGNWDARGALGAVTKWAAVVRDGAEAVQVTQQAVRAALSDDPGPVAMIYHGEALDDEVSAASVPRVYPTSAYLPPAPPPVDPAALAAAVRALATAERPVIVAGNGVRLARAHEELAELARALGAPVVTTAGGKGVLAEVDPYALGVFGNFGRPAANEAVGAADAVLAIGTRLAPTDTANESPELIDPERQVIVQVDVSATNLGLAFPVDHALLGDAGEAMRRLVVELGAAGGRPASPPWAAGGEEVWSAGPEAFSDEVPVLPQRAIAELQRAAPADAFLTCDAGENRLFMLHHFQTRQAGTFLQPAASGGMGYAIPAALAAKVVHPGRAAVAVCGDGGFAMTMNGLMTAIEMELPIVVMVLNNGVLGWVLHGQPRPIASRFAPFDHAAMARSMGCGGIRVERPENLADALGRAFAESDRPTVVEVLSSPEQTYRTVASPLAETAE